MWNSCRDDHNNPPLNDDDPPTVSYNADPIKNSSFKYRSSLAEETSDANQENGENTEQKNTKIKKSLEIVVPLKYLSNFWRTLDMPLINCEVSLTLTWSENCVLTNITTQTLRDANPNADPPVEGRERIDTPTNAIFKITDK